MAEPDYDAIARQHGGTDNPQPPKSLIERGREFGPNLFTSAGQFASDIAGGVEQAVMHPLDTLSGIKNIGAGVIEKMAPLPSPGPHEPYAEAAGNAIKDRIANRYGSWENFTKTLYEDPVGTLADASMLLSGSGALIKGAALVPKAAGLARTANVIGKVGQAVETAGAMTDPLRVGVNVATLPTRPFGLTQKLYRSAVKPPPGSYSLPEVRRMAETGLEARIPLSEGGLTKIWGLIEDLNAKVREAAEAAGKRGVTVDPEAVARRIDDIEPTFREQVNPEKSLKQLAESKAEFLRQHQTQVPYTQVLPGIQSPGYFPVGKGTTAIPKAIPVEEAQRLKIGTYQQIKKSFGEMKNAQIESQKALARGLKEEIAAAIPEIGALNAKESKFLELVPVLERAVRREANHQLFGIGTPIFAGGVGAATGSAQAAAAAGTLRAILDNPYIKSRLAIAIHHGMKKNPQRFGPARMATATARVEAYLKDLERMTPAATDEPATAVP
jgi:hypothetical protein